MGPVGAGKSALTEHMKQVLEGHVYYHLEKDPQRGEPLQLIPRSLRKEFNDALDELKMLHDAKNHDYATAENPYKNLEGVSRIGIEPWRGIVIRLMDKFERVEQFCTNGELAIKSEGMEDTFKDIEVYSTLAMILFRKSENLKELQGKKWTPVDDKYNGDESYTHPMIAMREAAEKQQEEEEYWKKKARGN